MVLSAFSGPSSHFCFLFFFQQNLSLFIMFRFRYIGRLGPCKSLNSRFNWKSPSKHLFTKICMDNNQCISSKWDPRGALIVFEGLDRCGKTSQCSRLLSSLERLGHSVESWRFPDRDTGVGQMISSYLSNQSQLDDHAIHLLFSANRWEKRLLSPSGCFYFCNSVLETYEVTS